MNIITIHITVSSDGTISTAIPIPAGEYEAAITTSVLKPWRSVLDLPVHNGPWDDSISLRREDMYGDDRR